MGIDDTDRAKLAALEVKLKELDVQLKEIELERNQRERENEIGSGVTRFIRRYSFLSTAGAAVLGLAVTAVGYLIQSSLNRQVEQDKLQGELILKAIETGNPEAAKKNLLFLVSTELLKDQTGKIRSLETKDVPVLPISNDSLLPSTSYRSSSSRTITEIIIRETYSATMEAALNLMREPGKLSYHYLIDKDGSVKRLVPDEQLVAIHTPGHNDSSIAVGLVHWPGKENYPDAQLKSLITLLADKSAHYGIDVSKILTAQELMGNRPDSDITKIISRVREDVQKEKKDRAQNSP